LTMKGSHCGDSIHEYSMPWACSSLHSISIPFFPRLQTVSLCSLHMCIWSMHWSSFSLIPSLPSSSHWFLPYRDPFTFMSQSLGYVPKSGVAES
jgi:hypothetical protein